MKYENPASTLKDLSPGLSPSGTLFDYRTNSKPSPPWKTRWRAQVLGQCRSGQADGPALKSLKAIIEPVRQLLADSDEATAMVELLQRLTILTSEELDQD